MISFPERLGDLFHEKKVSLEEVAEATGISKSLLSKYRDGKIGKMGIGSTYLSILADYFSVTTDYLLGKTDARSDDSYMQYMCNYTGLTQDIIQSLHRCEEMNKQNNAIVPIPTLLTIIFAIDNLFWGHLWDYLNHPKGTNEDIIAREAVYNSIQKIKSIYSDKLEFYEKFIFPIIENKQHE